MHSAKRMFVVAALLTVMAGFCIPQAVQAEQTWQAKLGGESKDMGRQAMAFLPNEMWIHAGDHINWTSDTGEIHTVSFFLATQAYQNFQVGCPGVSLSDSSFDGSHCVTAPPLVKGQSYLVKFPAPGNFKLICLVHPHMTGVIHVLAKSAKLPHPQAFYDEQAKDQRRSILADADMDKHHEDHDAMEGDHEDHDGMKGMLSARVIPGKARVIAGTGEMASTAAGFQSLSVVRFIGQTIEIHAGETVEWTNLDPSLPHTVTFGKEPLNPGPPSLNVSLDADGARHATITFVGESVHSGFLVAAPMDQSNVKVSPPGTTVLRVTFTHSGTYDYICALHDNLGMVGKVIVK